MTVCTFGTPGAGTVLVQPVGAQELPFLEKETALIAQRTKEPFCLLALQVEDWNDALSPWEAPAVFGSEAFGGGALGTLERLLPLCRDREKTFYLGGYSLAGLFALWASYRTDAFAGVAAASPSLWFPGFLDYMKTRRSLAKTVALSLGDREERVRHPVMKTVGDCVREAHALLNAQGTPCSLEWNPGNHFRDPELRTAKAFARLLCPEPGPEEN